MTFQYHAGLNDRGHIKAWTNGVAIEDKALAQLKNVASLPFIYKHVAVMPDVHFGMGATIGSVVPTQGAIIPAAIGVDIGCGMQAVKLDLTHDQLFENVENDQRDLGVLRAAIERAVPHGRTDNGGRNDRGAWHNIPDRVERHWSSFVDGVENSTKDSLKSRWEIICAKNPDLAKSNTDRHLGTLGGGNHFLEVLLDEEDNVWLMLHSGSRGGGAKIATTFIKKAKAHMERWHASLPDPDLAFLPEGERDFDHYIEAMHWAQDYAKTSRYLMMDAMIEQLGAPVAWRFDCHHNFAAKENHFGKNVWVTRKGATRARKGEHGIIPGSMGTGSFIVIGKGHEDAFQSCSHGAGRAMSRTQAFKNISLEQHNADTVGVECRRDREVLDESPRAYKDIGAVIAAQDDLITVKHRLRTIVNVKG